MNVQHTPGPWRHDETWGLIVGPRGEEIGAVHTGTVARRPAPRMATANARLIAAAPELLNHLCGVMEHIERGELMVCDMGPRQNQEATAYMLGEIKAAITKAKGAL